MATVINMPKLGFDMAEGLLVRWMKAEGDAVEQGEVLAEIETDKATVEVESEATGIILKHLVAENSIVPIGAPITVIGEQGEDFDFGSIEVEAEAEGGATLQAATSEKATLQVATPEEATLQAATPETPTPSPIAAGDSPTDGDGRLPDGARASPVARRLAAERGIEIGSIAGSGPQGRIVKRDVEAAFPAGAPTNAPIPTAVAATETVRVELTKLRAAIGRRMTAAKQQLPHFYVTSDLDAAPMMDLRRQLNSRMPDDGKFSVNDFLVKAAAMALREFPNLNASLDGDEIVRHGHINVGVAVALEGGLMTVVAKDVDRKPIRQLSSELRDLAVRARSGKVRPGDIEGSTFTVSNLGMFQVDHFIAIINPPEAAILAVGSVREEAVVVNGQVVPGTRLQVTLSADHRVTDGAEAARWLQVFRQYIENPVHTLV
ncbi:MAG: 2-oxo acid dehydrogenase subunit E2 [Chloroflexi bacterium]|nr:2-oxo acid dehydrogenase subunit E2 [Chloroflexota bacterium]MDK1044759.1 dihydrolipoamide acetyltransferase family protein [Anaerolineales bacterium]MCH8341929.1 2-oxo acid dehydrogenase subunit E2 [Chloroflexota bacterium]MCH8876283.1 2-oxo acid dehydrogenase subunit E2 [Chloroflexota bacterium]MCI0773458.1 2-oxo acid dehydrogenase subunit E2 [Chloroflexota bacterium]